MTDTEIIKKLKEQEYSTEVIFKDTDGNEFGIKDISLTMGGQYHQVIELEKIPYEENWFRTSKQCLEEYKSKLTLYESEEYKTNVINELGEKEAEFVLNFNDETEIPHLKYLIKYYQDIVDKEQGEIISSLLRITEAACKDDISMLMRYTEALIKDILDRKTDFRNIDLEKQKQCYQDLLDFYHRSDNSKIVVMDENN